jgi:hypothetical protein
LPIPRLECLRSGGELNRQGAPNKSGATDVS